METKDTAVALLKEWKRLDNSWVDEDDYRDELGEPIEGAEAKIDAAWDRLDAEKASISRRLDEIAEAAGIILKDGYFMYSDINAHYDFGRFDVRFRISGGTLPAREQQAIQEWLLIKNEEKTA